MTTQFTKVKIALIIFVILNSYGQADIEKNKNNSKFSDLKGPYLGMKPPGDVPEIFAPGIISTEGSEGCSGWGKDMEFFIFQRWINREPRLYITHRSDNVWSEPVQIKPADKYRVGDFTITPDGARIVFASKIFIKKIGVEGEGANIWIVNINKNGLFIPIPIGSPVNTKYHESYPCLSSNNNMYYFSRKPGGFGVSDMYLSEFRNGKYQKPINLGININTNYHEWDGYIAPDESYMIYCSTKPEGLGEDDLYISYRLNGGGWSKSIHMGNKINSAGSENRAYLSPDGKYLFYAGTKNGNRDIYWVDAKIINDLKPKQ